MEEKRPIFESYLEGLDESVFEYIVSIAQDVENTDLEEMQEQIHCVEENFAANVPVWDIVD